MNNIQTSRFLLGLKNTISPAFFVISILFSFTCRHLVAISGIPLWQPDIHNNFSTHSLIFMGSIVGVLLLGKFLLQLTDRKYSANLQSAAYHMQYKKRTPATYLENTEGLQRHNSGKEYFKARARNGRIKIAEEKKLLFAHITFLTQQYRQKLPWTHNVFSKKTIARLERQNKTGIDKNIIADPEDRKRLFELFKRVQKTFEEIHLIGISNKTLSLNDIQEYWKEAHESQFVFLETLRAVLRKESARVDRTIEEMRECINKMNKIKENTVQ